MKKQAATDMIRHKDKIKRTIPAMLNSFQEAEAPEQANRLENILVSMYASILLTLMAIGNLAAYFYVVPFHPYFKNSIWDSFWLFFFAASFETATRIGLRDGFVTLLVSFLSSVTLIFITVRFYPVLGPAVWTLFFIFLLLALIRIVKVMLIFLVSSIFLCNLVILFQSFDEPPFQKNIQYYVAQPILLIILGVVVLIFHKINANRYHVIYRKLNKSMEKMEKMMTRYGETDSTEKEPKSKFDRVTKVQEQLILQEKLAGIGQLTAGIAHEINNCLGFVCSNFETSQRYFASYHEMIQEYQNFIAYLSETEAEEYRTRIEKIKELEGKSNLTFISKDMGELSNDMEDGFSRIKEIVAGLRAFSRVGEDEKSEEYDLNQGMKDALMAVKNEIKHHLQIAAQLGSIPAIEAKGGEINQVLLNLILNAADAVKAKNLNGLGWIKITTECAGDFVLFQIEDNGVGIEEKDQGKIFDLFYTTKPMGKGTGLGLSVVYDIVVNKHKGDIAVSSKPGNGTKFTVRLPIKQPVELGVKDE